MENIAGAQIGSGLQLVGGVLSTTNTTSGSSVNGITGATNSNIGEGLYVNTSNYNLNFRNLIAGNNVTFNTTTSGITINSTATGGSGSTTPIISDIYANIETLVTNNQLIVGQHYLITDYQTKHIIPYTSAVNTGSIEPLIVLAVSTNKFNNLAYSIVYPEDIIHYDFNNKTLENSSAPRTGKITYRKDKFNNSCYYDFRSVKFRRWSVNCNVTWSSGSVYTKDSLIKYNNIIYQVTKTTTISDTTTPNDDSTHYCQFLDLTTYTYWSWVDDKVNFIVGNAPNKTNLTIGSYIDCYTFDDGTGNIVEGNLNNGIYNNEIRFSNSNNGGYNNIVFFGTFTFSNIIGDDSNNNTIGNNFYYNTIGTYFQSNVIIKEFYSNVISSNFYSNIIGNNFQYNALDNNFNSNTIGLSFQYNTIGNYFYSNTFGDNFQSNRLGANFYYNTIAKNFGGNTIGNNFYSNIIGENFTFNSVSNYFNSNELGNYFTTNEVSNTFQANIIKDNSQNNNISNNFYSNTIENNFQSNTIQDNINNIDFITATHVYSVSYNKTIFKGDDTNYYLSYFNGTTMIYVAANA